MQTRRQGAKVPMKETCQLDDTPDEDSAWIGLALLWKQPDCSHDSDKENEVNVAKPGQSSKRKKAGRVKKGLSKRQKGNNIKPDASQDSPPIFAFQAAKTSFGKRKLLKRERQLEEEEENKKRVESLVAYFKNLDEQKLETA